MTIDERLRIQRNLRALRKVARYTQEELAEKVGLCRSAYGQLERGLREPDLDTLYNLCKIYRISLDMLIECDIPAILNEYFVSESYPSESRRLLKLYSELSMSSRGRLMERAEDLHRMDMSRRRL